MINRKIMTRAAGVAAAVSCTIGLFSVGAAHADTFVPLPGGEITKTLSDGTVVNIKMVGESATISPSMGSTPVHRNAWVSGSAQVSVSGGGDASGGKIYPGYTVGCQVNIAGGGVSGEGEGAVDDAGAGTGGIGTGGELSLGPGQAQSFYVLDLEKADDYGNESHSKNNKFKGSNGSVTWADETIGLSGCGGYAQARSFVSVEVETDNVISWVTLWGQPFSLG
ncbi:MspA family porin [Nocardia ignorata]|uniref:MspA protein n=1 Tax=Nocardia ignorata TaxID=145285 RepID=A0A4R6PW26_NOCIG|nr:MspA family porin [Nocardia ignorata]TDP42563.1 MspA protein [Nocardia ignorata]